jgi:hypothetical protein
MPSGPSRPGSPPPSLPCRATQAIEKDAETYGDGHVPSALDEIPKLVVVTLLRAPRGRHGDDHRPFAHAAQLLEDIAGGPPACDGPPL